VVVGCKAARCRHDSPLWIRAAARVSTPRSTAERWVPNRTDSGGRKRSEVSYLEALRPQGGSERFCSGVGRMPRRRWRSWPSVRALRSRPSAAGAREAACVRSACGVYAL
jgi:hypothetical protein